MPPRAAAWHDPWAWITGLAVAPLVLHSLGAPLGEPVSDDFTYFHRALLEPRGSFFDGYGSPVYWRPLGRQLYFGGLGPALFAHPVLVPVLHTVCLALTALILYRAFRVRWSGPVAAAMASFILLAEATRMFLTIATYGEDVSALLLAALAIHEAVHGRLVTALAAITASLLGKETGVATAVLLPWLAPSPPGRGSLRRRLAWCAATLGVIAIWGLVYLAACRAHGMILPHELEGAAHTIPWFARYAWSLENAARTMFSLTPAPGAFDRLVLIAVVALLLGAAGRFAASGEARGRLAGSWSRIGWGAAWFLAAAAAITEVYPSWSSNRAVFAGIGFGAALTALLAAAHPALVAALVAVRLFAFSVSAGAPASVTAASLEPGASGFAYLARMQRLVRDTRRLLTGRFPTLPRGARVGLLRPPRLTEYAYGGSRGLQLWYADTTLRIVRYGEFGEHPEHGLAAIVEFDEGSSPQVMLVSPAAMHHYLVAGELVQREEWSAAADELALAESLQTDHGAHAFLGRVTGRRSLAWLGLGRAGDAEREARRSLALAPEGSDARYTLAAVLAFAGRRAEAQAQLDTLLSSYPGDPSARALRDSLRSWSPRGP